MESFLEIEERLTTVNCLLELMKAYCEQNLLEKNNLSVLKVVLDLALKEHNKIQNELDKTIQEIKCI